MDHRQASSSAPQSNRKEEVPTTFSRSKQNFTAQHFNSHRLPSKATAIAALQENRERERRELSQLNDRFASYIERVRFLEGQNKKLQLEIDHLRGKWDSKTSALKEKYDVEVHEARHVIDDTTKDRAEAELRAKRAEEEVFRLKEKCELLLTGRDFDRAKITQLEQQLLVNEADLNLFDRRLIDLEDEQKRAHHEYEQLNFDFQRITKDLDQEIITGIELTNQKQTLEDQIHFMNQIHSEEVEELKQLNAVDTVLDLSKFFNNELANAVENIRQEYEQLNEQQRTELQSWYQSKVTQAIQEIRSHRAKEQWENVREQEEMKRLKTLASDSQQEIMTIRRKNGELENRVRELEGLVQTERNNKIQATDERDRKIRALRVHLDGLGRDYDELVTTKSSLDSEISLYRRLLEGEEQKEGLKQIISHVQTNSSLAGDSTTYPRSYPRTDGSQESEERSSTDQEYSSSNGKYHLSSKSDQYIRQPNELPSSAIYEARTRSRNSNESSDPSFGNHSLMSTPYVPYRPLYSIRTESTIFDQIYGSYPRRPTSIGLNTQWISTANQSSSYKWNPSDMHSRRLKIRTFFDTAVRREQQQQKAITPPSSDYTDAYLSAFAAKPIPTRRIYRIAAPVFVNVAPIRTLLSTDNSIKTSETRFNTINISSISNSLDRIIPSLSSPSSTSSSSVLPDISTKSQPIPDTSAALIETKTTHSDRSTSLRDDQASQKPIHPSTFPVPAPNRSNVDRAVLSKSSQSPPSVSPLKTTYKPFVPFQAAPFSTSNNTHQNHTTERTVSSSLPTQKHLDRPDTLVFQHDEDMRSSHNEKPSPFITPAVDSPITPIETKTHSERSSTEELAAVDASKPIEILEKTVNQYDTIIDQISAILASVSPLSSTISSMSPGKSVLDCELTAEDSPILQRRYIEAESSQDSTATITNTSPQRLKGKHLIRDDSYDKLITAIADLDDELSPSPEPQYARTTIIEEEKEEPIASTWESQRISSLEQVPSGIETVSLDYLRTPLFIDERKDNLDLASADEEESEHPLLSIPPTNLLSSEISSSSDTKSDVESTGEITFSRVKPIQQQPDLRSSAVHRVGNTRERTKQFTRKALWNRKLPKHVTWGEPVINSEDNDSSSCLSSTDETGSYEILISTAEKKGLTSDESLTITEQQLSAPLPIETVVANDEVNAITDVESSNLDGQQITSFEPTGLLSPALERRLKLSTSPDTSSSIFDSVERLTTPSDLNGSRSSQDVQTISSDSSGDPRFVSVTDPSGRGMFNINEQLTTISDIAHKEITEPQMDSNRVENAIEKEMIEHTYLLPLSVVESPIKSLTDSISTRYISNDVYYSYLGDHKSFIERTATVDSANKKIALLVSLRQTIATPATPLIETIQSVVSSMRTLVASHPLKRENEVLDNSQNETKLTSTVVANVDAENNEYETRSEPASIAHISEGENRMLEDSNDVVMESLTPPVNTATSTNEGEEQFTSDADTIVFESRSFEKLILSSTEDVNTGHNERISPENVVPSVLAMPTLVADDIPEDIAATPIIDEDNERGLITDTTVSEQNDIRDDEEITLIDIVFPEHIEVETFPDEVPDPFALITDKNDSTIVSSSIEQNATSVFDQTTVNPVLSTKVIQQTTPPSEEKEQVSTSEIPGLSLAKEKISPTSALFPVTADEITPSTMYYQPSDSISFTDDVITIEKTDRQIVSTRSTMTESIPSFEIENNSTSARNEDNEIIVQIIDHLINDIVKTTLSQLQQDLSETQPELLSSNSDLNQSIIPQIDDDMEQSAAELLSESTSNESKIESIDRSEDLRDLSPTNTDPDSSELIHALQGHIIVLPTSPERVTDRSNKSSSTTPSSQITSSDRYVSYAIHQMGDSSQDRLPSFPIAADLPAYKTHEENVSPKPVVPFHQTKDDDSTEFDVTDNLTSYSDDILLQRLEAAAMNKHGKIDTSTTDDDVDDDEIEQHDLTDLEHIIDKLTQRSGSMSRDDEPYHCYDLATTPSSNDSSSPASRRQGESIYYIPGYSGLWRPSVADEHVDETIDYDADDERKTATKTRTIIRTLNSTRRPISFQHYQNELIDTINPDNRSIGVPIRSYSIDRPSQPSNVFSNDKSESDSYHTCLSSITKPVERPPENSNENIFLIRPRERGVSLPINMRIDCDDIPFRLSTSSPVDTQLYLANRPDSSSPSSSAHSRQHLLIRTDSSSSSLASSLSLNSHEDDQQKLSSWLNTINTMTTTAEGSDELLGSQITLLKSAKGPITISQCHSQGNYIIIENTSRSRIIDLTNWQIQQENENGDRLIFTFPDHCLLRPNHTLKILAELSQSEQRNDDLIAFPLSSWHAEPNTITTLINPEGKNCATLTKKTITSE